MQIYQPTYQVYIDSEQTRQIHNFDGQIHVGETIEILETNSNEDTGNILLIESICHKMNKGKWDRLEPRYIKVVARRI